MHLKLVFLWIPILWATFCCAAGVYLERIGFFRSRHFNLRLRGLELLFSGFPDKAEECYREALILAPVLPVEDRTRLMVCLGDSLLWQERYDEAMNWFEKALALGDPTGSCQQSICDLLLILRTDPERALIMAEQGRDLANDPQNDSPSGIQWNAVVQTLNDARYQARKANALHLLSRQDDARASIEQSLRILSDNRREIQAVRPKPRILAKLALGSRFYKELYVDQLANACWIVGLALSAMQDEERAAEQFRLALSAQPEGIYGTAASRKLAEIGAELP